MSLNHLIGFRGRGNDSDSGQCKQRKEFDGPKHVCVFWLQNAIPRSSKPTKNDQLPAQLPDEAILWEGTCTAT